MAENIQRLKGQPRNYKFDRGGVPTEFGPFIGVVKNNVDPTRQGRLQVFIEQFASGSPSDSSQWRTVSYCPPFYGATPRGGTAGDGTYLQGNQQSYGMWFTPPDLGVQVLCFFVAGDPNQGYYVGCVPDQGVNRMTPAIGATTNYKSQNTTQETYFADAKRMPVTEYNNAPENPDTSENPKFFDVPKPVHSYVAAVLFQQGLAADETRGSIGSSSQRESPSAVFGFSTPGRAVYQGGLGDAGSVAKLDSTKLQDLQVVARRGGHSLVMDDGDVEGRDNLLRIRTSKGHQIVMSDSGDCFYICHANGGTWLEFGKEGTVDVFSTNSINMRTNGTINFHADEDINIFAGKKITFKSGDDFRIQSDKQLTVATQAGITLYSEQKIGIKSNGALALVSNDGSWNGKGSVSLSADQIDLNGGAKLSVATPPGLTTYIMPDTSFDAASGWNVSADGTESVVTRAPTHEPWPYHNKGVPVKTSYQEGQPTQPPSAPALPAGTTITKTGGP
jgi:hypothetical protein